MNDRLSGAGHEIVAALRATNVNLWHPGRAKRILTAVRKWTFDAPGGLPKRSLVDIIPGVELTRSGAAAANRHFFDLPYAERFLLDVLIRNRSVRTAFEFGTFRGATTRLMAEAIGAGGEVHTIDLPAGPGSTIAETLIGQDLQQISSTTAARVVVHREDTATFDFEQYRNTFDIVFVDASHKYADVMRDSRAALSIVRPGGIVVWDDYHAGEPGVVRALHELAVEVPIVNVRWSRLALLVGDADRPNQTSSSKGLRAPRDYPPAQ